jgi:hypothetical protein
MTGVDWHGRGVVQAYERLAIADSKLRSFRTLDPQSSIVEVHDRLMFDAVVSGADSRTQHNLRYEYTTAKGSTYAMV